ncbi:GNAT family N-acetyltransferase [Couchioplanes caeruleus]|uniref:GNAT family N-acetyltransferase n=2 Tax=Couchioplanes caeruleus TaxID=56438 RepID=A0A1K0FJJ3_9ACTN|nr:GNAT family N-acetyltransferase [Couchioplanes caeruleus]OJF13039.1 GNAT family N-acetyltransferase [Couchioplanes caeruleus subsp. caeruleus]ROP34101.1 putative acetyltransferase [Couchioplanes caeruleus]
MLRLIKPTTELHAAWLASRDEWGIGVHQPGGGLRSGDDIESSAGFADWVARLQGEGDESLPPAAGLVHAAYWWIVSPDDTVLGAISLRYALTDFLLQAAGHVGYSVRPSARGCGVASWALAEVLDVARRRRLDSVLITCDEDNVASARVIEKHGGVLEDVRNTPVGRKRRYWIAL